MPPPRFCTFSLPCALVCLFTAQGTAAQDALYEAPPPPDAVFVRWLGELPEGQAGYRFKGADLPPGEVRPQAYAAVSAALLEDAQPGSFYTVLTPPGGAPRLVPEPDRSDRSKVHLLLISCEKEPVSLVAPDLALEVIGPVSAYSAAGRAVNPVAAVLNVRNSAKGTDLGRFDLRLTRGRNLTFLACGGTAALVEHSFHGALPAS
jgi:hypothetical protein